MGTTPQEICWRNATYKYSERSINAQGELDLIGDNILSFARQYYLDLELGIHVITYSFRAGSV